jgi:ribose 5-phosphate isomerase A
MIDADALKCAAAERAVALVEDGMVLGLGTGSTAAFAVAALGRRMAEEGIKVVAIPTSEATAAQARSLDIPLVDFTTHRSIDLTIDGADAVDLDGFALIKGLGGALLREKIVASASKRMAVIVDTSKTAGVLGSRTPVPVEIVGFGWQSTQRRIEALGAEAVLRLAADGTPRITDGGNPILDCHFGPIAEPAALAERRKGLVGVIETGLFIGLATDIIIAGTEGVQLISRS